jgi:hypothetical protein
MVLDTGVFLLEKMEKETIRSRKYADYVKQLIEFTERHRTEMYKGEKFELFIRRKLLEEFGCGVRELVRNPSVNVIIALERMAAWLKPSTQVPSLDSTVGEVMRQVHLGSRAECFQNVQSCANGSDKQLRELENCFRLIRDNGSDEVGFGITIRQMGEQVLLNVYIEIANGYNGEKGKRKVMHKIAAFLPADTELPGSGMTVRDYDDRVDPSYALKKVTENINRGKLDPGDAVELSAFLRYWPDFDLGGQSMKELAGRCVRAIIIDAFNRFQSGEDPNGYDLGISMAACLYYACLPPHEGEVILKVMKERKIQIDSSRCENYVPDTLPFSRKKKGGGFFSRLFGKKK